MTPYEPASITALFAPGGLPDRAVDLGGEVTPADIFAIAVEGRPAAVEGRPAAIGEAACSRMARSSATLARHVEERRRIYGRNLYGVSSVKLNQSRPKPRGGSTFASSERSSSQMLCRLSAVALLARFSGRASRHA